MRSLLCRPRLASSLSAPRIRTLYGFLPTKYQIVRGARHSQRVSGAADALEAAEGQAAQAAAAEQAAQDALEARDPLLSILT